MKIKTAYEGEANTNAYTDAEKSKLAGIESGATADQTGAQIKTAYEGEANTNAFTDADHSKLDSIEAGADVTDAANVAAAGAAMLDTTAVLDAAFEASVDDDGTKSSGTYTPTSAAGSAAKKIANNGAFTLAPPSPQGGNNHYVAMDLLIANSASAGAITTSGFSRVTGDSFTTTNGDEFLCRMTVYDIAGTHYSHLDVVALQ